MNSSNLIYVIIFLKLLFIVLLGVFSYGCFSNYIIVNVQFMDCSAVVKA